MEDKEIHGYIYLITNLINGKQYVGQTTDTIKIRFTKHCSDKKLVISRAIRKYGKENFKIEQIDIAYNQIELNLIEGVYMSWFNTLRPNGYNIKEIIDGKGKTPESTKEKLRKIANTPENLKIASENGKKIRGKSLGVKSKYCGIIKNKKKWVSATSLNKKRIHIGSYDTEIDAAKAYDIKALELFGYDCVLNFPELRQDYIDGKIIIKKCSQSDYSKSGIKDIYFCKYDNRWKYRYNKRKNTKSFKTLEEAIEFKNQIESAKLKGY